MSSTSSETQYEFTLTTAQAGTGNQDVSTFYCYSQNGMNDTLASEIVEALRALTPPPGSTITCTVN